MDAAGLSYLTLNHVVRYVKSFNWSVDEAYDRLVSTEKWRKDNDFLEIDPSDLKQEIGMKLIFNFGKDKAGRSLVYFKANRYDPSKTDQLRVQKFMTYALDKVCAS